jgi:MATE family multidrug resistance protein
MNRKILALAIPSIISNISVPLVSAVDTMLMGHLSASHLAALGIVSMIFLFLYGTMNFLRMGTTGITAQAYGQEANSAIAQTLYRALLVAFALGTLLLVFQELILYVSFYLMNIEQSYYAYAQSYFDIRIYTAPAVFMSYVLMGCFFGMQNALYPLWITLFINVLNIIISYYMVNTLNMSIEGAAYGTLISQYAGVILGFLLLLKYKQQLQRFKFSEILQGSELLRFLQVNREIFVRTLLLTFVFAFFYAQAAKDGEETLTVMILLLQFIVWFSYSLDGFANAAESLVGRYYGAKDWENYNKVILYLFYWGFGFTLLYMLVYGFLGNFILQLYTNQEEIIANTLPFMPYIILMPLLSFAAFIWDGIFIGMTATKALRNTIVFSTLFFLGLFYLTKGIDFSYALWINFLLFFLFRGVIQSWLFWKYSKNLK